MTKAEESKLNAKAEAIMMGFTQKVDSNEEAIYLIGYIARTLKSDKTGEEIFAEATKYTKNAKIQYVNTSTIMGMQMLSLPMITDEDDEEFNITNPYGVFGYVYNFSCPDCSELGYTGYEHINHRLRRAF